ncbi:MAG: hypothetical protein H7Y18_18965 [Clostridiaceae bacterium]|nr:hypothetical protein [Clostridiaceae bacterium]
MDVITRFTAARTYLINNRYKIRRNSMVWCQGETDGDKNMSSTEYKTKLQIMIEAMVTNGAEKCFIIRIGNHRGLSTQYNNVIKLQRDFCKAYKKAVLVSTKFDEMSALRLMKDTFHYKQSANNTVGTEAGENTAFYIVNNKEPMIDRKYCTVSEP